MKNPAPQSARGSDESLENRGSSLAVFYVEQVALNRHDQSMSKITSYLYNIFVLSDQAVENVIAILSVLYPVIHRRRLGDYLLMKCITATYLIGVRNCNLLRDKHNLGNDIAHLSYK